MLYQQSSFGCSPGDQKVKDCIQNLNKSAKNGQRVAIVAKTCQKYQISSKTMVTFPKFSIIWQKMPGQSKHLRI